MARPLYETEQDRVREASAIDRFADRFDYFTIESMPRHHRADYRALRDGKVVLFIEVKTRTCSSEQYETYTISKKKLDSLVEIAEKEDAKPLLLVQWTDRSGYISVTRYLDSATFKEGGRWDRKDPLDVELMAEARIDLFKFLPDA